MNHSIATADRNTHLKVIVVALIAAISVATIGIAARISNSGVELAGVQAPGSAQVVKAGKPVVWTGSGRSTVN
ncbi:hypothetical protein GJW-30_1_01434 [Variibacter gotjawalensis]|uniref:Uncharacterized protein n=1 Tax=Variibacter gotjawalensis TaxID=1333996 RepID=A0A0S3PSI1_9BRAD|nr:hypothetical protein [Variibacter gotjawalensis]NIK49219.1 hypothetical protein [Variibacter gotjawalensis]RZS51072.1 hypothetical protein EV661_3545 [Variibacter gotjawalensis]BAT58906.1 hypothetical protein GJW-30_1_01434 [Variibacter gotjawalensis]